MVFQVTLVPDHMITIAALPDAALPGPGCFGGIAVLRNSPREKGLDPHPAYRKIIIIFGKFQNTVQVIREDANRERFKIALTAGLLPCGTQIRNPLNKKPAFPASEVHRQKKPV